MLENQVDTHFVYILKCRDDSYYVGCTNNLDRRFQEHQKGYVKSTSYRLPVELITYTVFSR